MKLNSLEKIKVSEVMLTFEEIPVLQVDDFFVKSLESMTQMNIGTSCVVDKDNLLIGIITDGDIRRRILKDQKPFSALAVDYCLKHINKNPTVSNENDFIVPTLTKMSKLRIWDIPVVDDQNRLQGLLHMHSIIKILI